CAREEGTGYLYGLDSW
nr:immunoglobulin heavy chain junction region [Macaca mulatta]MPN69461.1 immunoglobulin heavy chain junction region [Macaca mulatta]MPN69721.1 immunoglobulin heavy chain junction region [Macaca mulatta]MPN69838.1 immunoglobulin heavy chain junction region [Macaca mulatta]MPN70234.1 immunoglobulin heavy chain junction region [Macaca mulatta]